MTLSVLTPKDPEESLDIAFEFDNLLVSGETLTDAVVTAEVYRGTDPSPSAILTGLPAIDTDLTTVIQRVDDGVPGVSYKLRCTGTTTDGHVYVVGAKLAVRTI